MKPGFLIAMAGLALSILTCGALAAPLEIQPVTDGVYALDGEKQQRNPENLAITATFGAVVTAEGVLLIDPGGSW